MGWCTLATVSDTPDVRLLSPWPSSAPRTAAAGTTRRAMTTRSLPTRSPQTPNALGYFGHAYYLQNRDRLKAVGIDNGRGCVMPSPGTVMDETYQPLSRPIFLYVSQPALSRPEVAAFARFAVAVDRASTHRAVGLRAAAAGHASDGGQAPRHATHWLDLRWTRRCPRHNRKHVCRRRARQERAGSLRLAARAGDKVPATLSSP